MVNIEQNGTILTYIDIDQQSNSTILTNNDIDQKSHLAHACMQFNS
jgi:hypothetical protein